NEAFLLAEEKRKEQKNLLEAREAKNSLDKKWVAFRLKISEQVPKDTVDAKVKELISTKRDGLYGELKTLESTIQDIDSLESQRAKLKANEKELVAAKETVSENETQLNLKKAELPALDASRSKLAEVTANLEKVKSDLLKTEDLKKFFTKLEAAQKLVNQIQEKLESAKNVEELADEELSNAYKTQVALQSSELAKALLPGHACPVCGSLEHPSPKTPDEGIERPDIPKIEKKRAAAQASRTKIESEMSEPKAELLAAQNAIRESGLASIEQVESMVNSQKSVVDQAQKAVSAAKTAQIDFDALVKQISTLESEIASKKGQIGELEKAIPLISSEVAKMEKKLKIKPGESISKPDLSEI
ncbi:MAG: hypothetical protein EBV76_12010, partial [Gammaproteobacteria bacterium]|nr:hypothetical protein [Gammaproteobacteria bacterium]